MKQRILIVADDAALRATLARWLLGAGYAVELSESAHRAREVVANETVNLAIVAPRGMGASGAELAQEIGERVKHVIFVVEPTAETTPSAEPETPSAGSISWPCSEQDLLARVSSELAGARFVAQPDAPAVLRFEGYTLDAGARSCLNPSGHEVTLTRAEFSLLLAFARQPGRVLSRDELTHVVAGRGAEPDDRSVDVLISRLRRKIEPDPKAPRIIVTMPGEGYKFIPKPQVVAAEPATVAPSLAAAMPSRSDAGDLGPAEHMQAPAIESLASRPTQFLRLLVPAAIVILAAGLGWEIWSTHAGSPQAVETLPPTTVSSSQPSQPGVSAERRAAVFKRMVAGMQNDRFNWRTIDRLAVEAGVDEAEAREILAEHPDEVVLGKSRDGKLLARLSDR
jgi:two-component system torCAD operon response regulator TorR